MTHTKLYAEEQTIQQKIKIPTNFVELKTVGKNYICSTKGWPKEPVCEQYRFSAQEKLVQIDIPHELMEKLELELGKEITYPIYISQSILEKKPDEFGGITIKNEKDIFLQTEGIILIQEKETQIDLTSGEITDLKQKLKKSEELSQETQQLLERVLKDNEEKHIAIIFFEKEIKDLVQRITELRRDLENETIDRRKSENRCQELERVIRELRKNEQVLISLQNRISDLQKELGDERLSWEETKQDLQTKIRVRDENLHVIQQQYGNEILKYLWQNNFLKREVNRLDNITELLENLTEKELKENHDTINNLTTRVNNLNATLGNRNQTISGLNNQITNLSRDISTWRNKYDNSQRELSNTKRDYENAQSNYNYYYGRYCDKNREVDNLRDKLSSEEGSNRYLRNEISRLNSQISNIKYEKEGLEAKLRVVNKQNMNILEDIVNDNVRDETTKNRILDQYVVRTAFRF